MRQNERVRGWKGVLGVLSGLTQGSQIKTKAKTLEIERKKKMGLTYQIQNISLSVLDYFLIQFRLSFSSGYYVLYFGI